MKIEAIKLLRRMVAIPSPSGREETLARFLVETMARSGFEARIDPAGNAVGIRGDRGEEACEVVLLGHMDTVPGRIPVRVEGEYLFGRGAVDAKGPLAAFVAAAAAVDLPPGVRLVVAGAVEEESATSRGARFLREAHRPAACVIGEPSGWTGVTLGYKGRLLVDARFEKAEGHSAGPDAAAAERLVSWWRQVEAVAEARNAGVEGVFHSLTPSLRRIRSESDGLIDRAEAALGFRLPPGLNANGLIREITGLDREVKVRFRGYEPAFASRRDSALVRAFTAAIRKAGERPRLKVKSGTSDMNVVGPAWQCPIVAYGPGDSRLDHSPYECLSLAEYGKSITVLTRGLEALFASALRERGMREAV